MAAHATVAGFISGVTAMGIDIDTGATLGAEAGAAAGTVAEPGGGVIRPRKSQTPGQ